MTRLVTVALSDASHALGRASGEDVQGSANDKTFRDISRISYTTCAWRRGASGDNSRTWKHCDRRGSILECRGAMTGDTKWALKVAYDAAVVKHLHETMIHHRIRSTILL